MESKKFIGCTGYVYIEGHIIIDHMLRELEKNVMSSDYDVTFNKKENLYNLRFRGKDYLMDFTVPYNEPWEKNAKELTEKEIQNVIKLYNTKEKKELRQQEKEKEEIAMIADKIEHNKKLTKAEKKKYLPILKANLNQLIDTGYKKDFEATKTEAFEVIKKDWYNRIPTYGPLWTLSCCLYALLTGSNISSSIIAFTMLSPNILYLAPQIKWGFLAQKEHVKRIKKEKEIRKKTMKLIELYEEEIKLEANKERVVSQELSQMKYEDSIVAYINRLHQELKQMPKEVAQPYGAELLGLLQEYRENKKSYVMEEETNEIVLTMDGSAKMQNEMYKKLANLEMRIEDKKNKLVEYNLFLEEANALNEEMNQPLVKTLKK